MNGPLGRANAEKTGEQDGFCKEVKECLGGLSDSGNSRSATLSNFSPSNSKTPKQPPSMEIEAAAPAFARSLFRRQGGDTGKNLAL